MKFRLRGISFCIGYEAVAALTAVLLLDREGRVTACLFAAVLHETGHLIVMRLCACRVNSVRVRLFDVLILADKPRSFLSDFAVTAGGCMANLIAAIVCSIFSPVLTTANLIIGGFNLLPVETLDGGRLLMLILCRRYSANTAVRVVRICSFVFLIPFFLLGAWLLLSTGYNYSLLAISLYLLAVLLIS